MHCVADSHVLYELGPFFMVILLPFSTAYFSNPYQTFMLLYFPAAEHFIVSTQKKLSDQVLK